MQPRGRKEAKSKINVLCESEGEIEGGKLQEGRVRWKEVGTEREAG